MADYYPVLARAVSRLAVSNAQARQELYEHARTVLVAELERNNPERSAQAALCMVRPLVAKERGIVVAR